MFFILIYILSVIGFYVTLFYLYENLKTPVVLFISGAKQFLGLESTATFIRKYGEWFAITGATDGIGKAFAKELARRGLNCVLISRNGEKLNKVAKEIENDFSVKTRIVAVDFAKDPQEACRAVEEQLNTLPVKILINNVGQSTPEPGPMVNFTDKELWDVINTNIGPVTQLCRYFIKRLRDAGETGLIVNVSSVTENFPVPYGAVYAATKSYIRSLTLSLQQEVHPSQGIDIQLLSPHFVVTKINNYSKYIIRGGNRFIPDPDTYARSAVNRLGKLDHTTGYCWHDLELAAIRACPTRLRHFLSNLFARRILSRSKVRSQ